MFCVKIKIKIKIKVDEFLLYTYVDKQRTFASLGSVLDGFMPSKTDTTSNDESINQLIEEISVQTHEKSEEYFEPYSFPCTTISRIKKEWEESEKFTVSKNKPKIPTYLIVFLFRLF